MLIADHVFVNMQHAKPDWLLVSECYARCEEAGRDALCQRPTLENQEARVWIIIAIIAIISITSFIAMFIHFIILVIVTIVIVIIVILVDIVVIVTL